MLLERCQPRQLDRLAPLCAGLVRLRDHSLPVRLAAAVELDLERSLALSDGGNLGLRLEAAKTLDGELEQVPGPSEVVARGSRCSFLELLDGPAREQRAVMLVYGLDLELLLVTREVQVILAIE